MSVFQTKAAFMVSRRTMIWTGSTAAVVNGLPWCEPEITAPKDAPQACDTVCALRRGMDSQIDQETAKHSWTARPRRADAHV